jgi:predicted nucleic acid-binding protein
MNENTLLAPNGAAPVRARPKVYMETTVFAALFGREDEKWRMARDTLGDGREGRIEVVASVLTTVECDGLALEGTVDPLFDFFESEWIIRCNVDPFVSATARRLREQLGEVVTLTPNLWLHVATAVWEGCNYLMSHERRLLKLNGQKGLENLKIMSPARPWDTGQMSLIDLEGVMPESNEGSMQRSLVI